MLKHLSIVTTDRINDAVMSKCNKNHQNTSPPRSLCEYNLSTTRILFGEIFPANCYEANSVGLSKLSSSCQWNIHKKNLRTNLLVIMISHFCSTRCLSVPVFLSWQLCVSFCSCSFFSLSVIMYDAYL